MIKPFRFTVKNAIYQKDGTLTGKSPAQGNPNAQPTFADHIWVYFRQKLFLDPSYGKGYDEENSTLEHYCKDNLTSIFIENNQYKDYLIDTSNQKINGCVEEKDIHLYLYCDKEKPLK